MKFSTIDFQKSRIADSETRYIIPEVRFELESKANISLSIYRQVQDLVHADVIWVPLMDVDESLFEVIK